jgi:UDP-N-acetylglucosamine--N-acetylmuramyl-(pentapeptide) pyrophosphoryl-undecaprenol N-acetylglucosamine transferase
MGRVSTTLLVASTGGHLKQLERLSNRLEGASGRHLWVTFDTLQSRSLLAGRDVVFGRYTHSRDLVGTAANARLANRLLRRNDVGAVVSTGAAVALSFMLPARLRRIPCHYIESAARLDGPSLTGRLLRTLPGVHLYTQYRAWEHGPWLYRGSVFDGFEPVAPAPRRDAPLRVVVALGTIRYPFLRLAQRLAEILPQDADVLFQSGSTDTSGTRFAGSRELPATELEAAMRDADVVVAHAGVGSALSALEAGRQPLLVPRRAAYGEHVDDHQEQVASELEARGLALVREAGDLTHDDVAAAAGRAARPTASALPFRLDPA